MPNEIFGICFRFGEHPSAGTGIARAGASGSRRQLENWTPLGSRGEGRRQSTYGCIIEIKNEGEDPETLLGATIDGAGTGVIYQIFEKDGKFSSKPVEHGLFIKPHGSIELTPATYQIRFGNITKTLTEDSMVEGTLIFERLQSVPVHFMVEQDDTAPKEETASGHQGM